MNHSLPLPDWLAGPGADKMLDVVVVGSGYGGAVAALRLAEKGHRVVVLERGSEYRPGDFPNDIAQLPAFQRASGPRGPLGSPTGLFDWHVGSGMIALVANGLGGGSLINAGVMMRPDAEVFAQPVWPAPLRLDALRAGGDLARAYERAADELGGAAFADLPAPAAMPPELPKSAALRRLAEAMRQQRGADTITIGPATVTIDLARCTRCGDCYSGCNVEGAKRTLDRGYLAKAQAAGAELVTHAQVVSLAPLTGGGWTLSLVDTTRTTLYKGREDSLKRAVERDGVRLRAHEVVLAAGSLGSTEILLRSRELEGPALPLSPALGTRLSANGDGLSGSVDETLPVDGLGHGAELDPPLPPVGPTITTVLDLRQRPALAERIVVQDCAVPGALRRVFQETLATVWALQHLGEPWRSPRHASEDDADPLAASPRLARHTQLLLAMGHDDSSGRLVWMPEMNAAAPYWARPQDVPSLARQAQVFEAARALGGLPMPGPWWQALPDSASAVMSGPKPSPMLLTVHPLGGCPMSDEFEHGVVDHRGRVWKGPQRFHEGLIVLDGAIVPSSLGCNPLWTITALAERAMALRPDRTPLPKPPPRVMQPPRQPLPLRRGPAPPHALVLRERLELRTLPLQGALRDALGRDSAEVDLELEMRHPDAHKLWDEDPCHALETLSGRLRLAVRDPAAPPGAPPEKQLSYAVTGGRIELLASDLTRGSLLRTGLTWFVLRGYREFRTTWRQAGSGGLSRQVGGICGMLALWRHARQQRQVHYDLRLEREGAAPSGAPAALRIDGGKTLRYAASWGELLGHLWRRFARGRQVRPGDLRPGWFEQLTQPTLSLREATPGAGTATLARGRFAFDIRALLQRAPMQLEGSSDSNAGLLALAAYPLLIGRVAMLTRLLDLRLPDYSGRPVADPPRAADRVLRRGPIGGATDVTPECRRIVVPRGDSSSDDGSEDPADIELLLWRYRRLAAGGQPEPAQVCDGRWHGRAVRRARCVLMLHAFGMSSLAFTHAPTDTPAAAAGPDDASLAEHLYAQGHEVWMLESRLSPQVAAAYGATTLDQHGLRDIPGAVDHVLATLADELGEGAPLQIGVFAHCMGAAGAAMALLQGLLHHAPDAGDPKDVRLPKLAALVCSQTHPYMVGSRNSQAKTWVASFIRDLAGRRTVPLAVRGPVGALLDSVVDRLFASLPVPEGERCPDEGSPRRRDDDDCATCRRIRFLDGQLFAHHHLTASTHAALPHLFGDASVRLFAHGARLVEYERLVSEDGFNAYVTDARIQQWAELPVRFVHGAENDLFDAESALRSSQQWGRLHPAWVARYGLERPGPQGAEWVCHDIIEGYGHLDVLIGKRAPRETYSRLTGLFEQALVRGDALPGQRPKPAEPTPVVRLPLAGPWVGVPEPPSGERRRWPVAFLVDDRRAEGGSLTQRAVAWAQDEATGQSLGHFELPELLEAWAQLPASGGHALPRQIQDPDDSPPGEAAPNALRVAAGWVEVPASVERLSIECASFNLASGKPRMPAGRGARRVGIGAADRPYQHGFEIKGGPLADLHDKFADLAVQRDGGRTSDGAAGQPPPAEVAPEPLGEPLLGAFRKALETTLAREAAEARLAAQPFPPTVSALRLRQHDPERRRVRPLPPPDGDGGLRFAAMSCAYPGTPWDRDRASLSYARLRQRCEETNPPRWAFLLGDQIYADASAGLVDPLSPIERYGRRHEAAWAAPGLRGLMQRLPLVMTPDDHEFINAYPDGAPLYRGDEPVGRPPSHPGEESPREAAHRIFAERVLELFQLATLPRQARDEGWHAFESGGVRYFVADTRRFRTRASRHGTGPRILSTGARSALQAWVECGAKGRALHCFVSGSVVMPGLQPGSEPAQSSPLDTWQAAPLEREWLLGLLLSHLPGRFVLLSGDYHVSLLAPLCLGTRTVGAAIIAPPVYAPLPYANATPSTVWMNEALPVSGGILTLGQPGASPLAAHRGSGFGLVDFRREDGGRWSVGLETTLTDFELGQERTRAWPGILLG